MEIKVSIVVPVYNIEAYIGECIRSLQAQTLREIEIIFVDDGSTDQSGAICDKAAGEDSRIRVVHKDNGGLSSARNAGIDIAAGQYIGFVDGDDIVCPEMYRALYDAAAQNHAAISICRFHEIQTADDFAPDAAGDIAVLDHETALLELFKGRKYFVAACDKLYRRELFEGIRYPVGKVHEDMFTTYKLFEKSQRAVFVNRRLYGYRVRVGSITRSHFHEKRFDNLIALNEILDYYKGNRKLLSTLYLLYFDKTTYLLNQICENALPLEGFRFYRIYRSFVLKRYQQMMECPELTDSQKKHITRVKRYRAVFYLTYRYREQLERLRGRRIFGKLRAMIGEKRNDS